MQMGRDTKRTGVYRVSGNIGDFQLELKLRHISEWLPVPKFEYAGAQANATSSSVGGGGVGGYGDHYSELEESEPWSDCRIYLPQGEDFYGVQNRLGFYTSNHKVGMEPNQIVRRRVRSPVSLKAIEDGVGVEEEAAQEEAQLERRSSRSTSQPSWSILSERNSHNSAEDQFYERNRELCNGSIATIRISWQQKFFSHAELERHLPDPGGCATKLQRRYHSWALETHELQQRHLRKLALANQEGQQQDEHQNQDAVRRRVRKSRRKQTNRSSAAASRTDSGPTVTPRALSSASMSEISLDDPHFAARTCLIHTLVDGDAEDLLPPEARQLHLEGQQLMYVYADLSKDTLLVSLRYDPGQGLLYVYPDFSNSAHDLDYMVQIERDNDCRQLYAYGFENATPLEALLEGEPEFEDEQTLAGDDGKEDLEQELPVNATGLELVEYYQRRRLAASERCNLMQFELPPKRMRRVCLLLELQTAQHFENANVHVRYYIQPPPNTLWEAPAGEDPLCGATATCRNAGDWRLANLGHCWQLTLLCEEQHQPDQQLLHLYFEVISIDSWQRERCEGYAHYSLPLIAPMATKSVRLQCIRPLGTWLDALNRYFIGGRQLFDFVSYFDVQKRQSELHSRLNSSGGVGRAMRTTGSIFLRMQKLQQRQIEGTSKLFQFQLELGNSDDDYDGGGGSSDEKSKSTSNKDAARATTLDEVIAAYVEARQRIESLLLSMADK